MEYKISVRLWFFAIVCVFIYAVFGGLVKQPGQSISNAPGEPAAVEGENGGMREKFRRETEPAEDGIVGEILYDRNNTIYYKHLPEIEKYTDEFGVDLDRLLSDYGYYFLVYDTEIRESPHYGQTRQLPESDYYWIVFTRDDSNFEKNIAIHSFGGWIECFDGDASYSMMPLTYEEPDVTVGLHEVSYKVNKKVLALLMEYLDEEGRYNPHVPLEEFQTFQI